MAITDCEYIVILYIEFTNRKSQFQNAMMTQRSNTSTRVRKQAGPSIFNCTAADLKSLRVPNLLGTRSLYTVFLAHTLHFTTVGYQLYLPWDTDL